MTKTSVIKAEDENELVMKMSKETFFASQPVQKKDGTWVCFIYSKEETSKNEQKEEQEELATGGQINYLNVLNVQIPKGLTKKAASKLIDENKFKGNK